MIRRRLLVTTLALLLTSPIHHAHAQSTPTTPAPGSPERKAIMDAMRTLGDNHTRVFVVRYLKMQSGWAWLTANPQSPDGSQHYEPESALLHLEAGAWKVIDQPCAEDGCDAAKEVARIRAAHPDAPAAIFPVAPSQ